jgi:hypothetical protein
VSSSTFEELSSSWKISIAWESTDSSTRNSKRGSTPSSFFTSFRRSSRPGFCHVHAKFQIVQSGTGFGNILYFGVGTHKFFKRTPGVSVRRDLHHFVREMLHSSGKNFERSD